MFAVGQLITISGLDSLPRFWHRWPWQDGDRRIIRWLYRMFGWTLNGIFEVTAVTSSTSFEVSR